MNARVDPCPLAWAVRYSLMALLCLLLAACAGPPAQHPASSQARVDPDQRTEVVMTALSLLDTHYRYGGGNVQQGFDCSGLVKYVFAHATGTRLPHNTEQIARMSRPVARRDLAPGDLVFFNTLGRPNSHMGIYLGDNRFINAPSSGGQVRIDSLQNRYYQRHFQSVGTLFAR